MLEIDLRATLRPAEIIALEARASQAGLRAEDIIAEDIRRGLALALEKPRPSPRRRGKTLPPAP